MTTLTIFVSSPGDVQNERAIVGKVVERLQARFWSFIRLVTKPSECDIVLGVLWNRLGTPLPKQFDTEDGKSFQSGTEKTVLTHVLFLLIRGFKSLKKT